MCLIAFAYKCDPTYKLLLIANRDEFYKRPTRKAQFWVDENLENILAGKDLEAGGTWMGVHKTTGVWCALTNYRDLKKHDPDAPSRGNITLNFLKENLSPNQYANDISSGSKKFNGYNLLMGNLDEVYHYSNISDELTKTEPGVHGLSNALLNSPWPKVNRSKRRLNELIKNQDYDIEDLFSILQDEEKAPIQELPDTGLSLEMEKTISPVFIKTDGYGTRCSTVLMIDFENNITFLERRFIDNGEISNQQSSYSFKAGT